MKKVSFILCTYNMPRLIARCLNSILKQKINLEKEVIIIDGGSGKETLYLLEDYKRRFEFIKIFNNKNQLPEGYGNGKWLGWKKCNGDFVVIIDQDNELQEEDCIQKMLGFFEKENIFGCLCLTKSKEKDSLTNKYIALMGTDPFFAYRSIDGIKSIKKIGKDKGDYSLIKLDKNNILITGGNCFVYRKKDLDKVGGYVQDTENIHKLVKAGFNKLAISKFVSTHHFATTGFIDFIKKKKKWAKTYKKDKNKNFSYLPKTKKARKEFIINLFLIFLLIPSLFLSMKKFIETKEKAWLLHPILTFITGFIYFFYTFIRLIFD